MSKISTLLIYSAWILICTPLDSTAQTPPEQGDLLISEFMANPAAVSDTRGEWFEIYNCSQKNVLLNGIIIADLNSNRHVLTSEQDIILAAGEYFLLARNADPSENGGLNPDYVYSGFTLGNSEDQILIFDAAETLLASIDYDADWAIESGKSLELNPGIVLPEVASLANNWHLAVQEYGSGDLGTPGVANSASSGIPDYAHSLDLVIFPNPFHDYVFISSNRDAGEGIQMQLMNLLGQSIPIQLLPSADSGLICLDMTLVQKGMYVLSLRSGTKRKTVRLIRE